MIEGFSLAAFGFFGGGKFNLVVVWDWVLRVLVVGGKADGIELLPVPYCIYIGGVVVESMRIGGGW